MTRTERIIAHLKAKGAQYVGCDGDKIVTDQFTEHVFRMLDPSVRVREWKNGLIEVLFVNELCAGAAGDPFHVMPEMEWVLEMIDQQAKPYPIDSRKVS